MYDLNQANEELKKVEKARGAYLLIEGPEQLTRTKNAIPDGLSPGVYKFAWIVPAAKDGGEPTRPVSGTVNIELPEEEEQQEQQATGQEAIMLTLINRLDAMQSTSQERDREYYKAMLELHRSSAERLEEDRKALMGTFQDSVKSFMKGVSEQVRTNVSVHPPESSFWEDLVKENIQSILPIVQTLAHKFAATEIPVSPADGAP